MAYTQTEREVADYCNNNEFISMKVFDEFKSRLERENNFSTFSYHLEKFAKSTCPKCNTQGFFKWHFLGKLKHPEGGFEWYTNPGVYIVKQLKDIFKMGGDIAVSGDDNPGCSGFIIGFLIAIFFRLPFTLILIPIQAIVSLTQKKPE